MQPTPRPSLQRFWLALALVAGAVVMGFLAWRAFDAARDVSGESIVLERAPDVPSALELDVARTQTEAPLFAALLDEASVGGKAASNDPALVAEALAYLAAIAREHDADSFFGPPIDGAFNWGGDTFRALHFAE